MPTNVHKIKRNRNGSAKKGVPHASGYPEAKSISFPARQGNPSGKGRFQTRAFSCFISELPLYLRGIIERLNTIRICTIGLNAKSPLRK